MIKESLFAAEERETKLDKLGDVLQVLEKHVDFGALAAAVDQAAPRPSREKGGRPPLVPRVGISNRNHGTDIIGYLEKPTK